MGMVWTQVLYGMCCIINKPNFRPIALNFSMRDFVERMTPPD